MYDGTFNRLASVQCDGRTDRILTLFIPSCEPFKNQIDRQLKVVLADGETLRETAAHEQQPLRLPGGAERPREPPGELGQRLPLPRGIRATSQDQDVTAGAGHHLHPVGLPRPTHLQHTLGGPVDDVGHRVLRHGTHADTSHRVRATPDVRTGSPHDSHRRGFRGREGMSHPPRAGRSATTSKPAARSEAPDSPAWV